MNNPTPKRCGAKKRNGEPCDKWPVKGRERCRLHGGAIPRDRNRGKANENYKNGLYVQHLSPEEQQAWKKVSLGAVDDELRMCRIWLARCIALEAKINENPNSASNLAGFELSEIKRSVTPDFSRTESTSKRPDVMGRANMLLGRIAQLEKTRAELLATAANKPGVDIRYVVELPAEEGMGDWLKSYGKPE
jgi:hypothetical protein